MQSALHGVVQSSLYLDRGFVEMGGDQSQLSRCTESCAGCKAMQHKRGIMSKP